MVSSTFHFYFLLIEGQLLHNVVLVSTVRHESAINMCVCVCVCNPPSLESLSPTPHPTPLGHHRAGAGPPVFRSSSLLSVTRVVVYTCQCFPLSVSFPLLPPLCPQSVLYVCISVPDVQISSSVPFF